MQLHEVKSFALYQPWKSVMVINKKKFKLQITARQNMGIKLNKFKIRGSQIVAVMPRLVFLRMQGRRKLISTIHSISYSALGRGCGSKYAGR